ncbi:hypothetical protein [Micromonospora sp. LOL_015]
MPSDDRFDETLRDVARRAGQTGRPDGERAVRIAVRHPDRITDWGADWGAGLRRGRSAAAGDR